LFTFDASRLDLAREFKARPFGEHSPDLQYLLNLMRSREVEGRYVLVMTRPHAQWTLARLTEGNHGPPVLSNTTFDDLATAEWEVFKLRWEALAGRPLDIA
jgi:N,N-dimethylformamidase